MPSLTAQLQRDNARLTTQCETLKTELAALQQRYQVLSRSEARYRQVVENSPISISFLSVDGQHVEANAAFERMMGFTVEDSQRVGFNVFTDPALEENGTRPYMLRAMAGETVIEPPTNFYDASQLYGKKAVENYIPGQGHYFPIWNEDGEVQEIVEMSPMVTDLLQSQAEAQAERERAAQERAKLLSTVAQVANLLLRSQDYTAVLPEVVRLLGEVVGSDRCAITQELPASANQPHRVRLLTEWHREEVASVLTGSPEFGSGVEIDIPSSFHQPLLQGDAINFVVSEVAEPDWRAFFEAHDNVSMLIVPIMLADGCWGHIGFDNCQDARLFDEAEIAILQVAAESIAAAIERQQQDDALRESEKRYRTLFELSSEGIYRFELEPPLPLALSPEERMELGYQVNQIVEVNHAFVEQYGCDTPEDLVGTKIGDFYDHEYSQANDQVNLDLVRDLRVSKIETVETDRLGNRHWFISSVVCDVRDDAIVGGWGVQTDITELKQTQQSLLEAEQARALELERYNTELKQAVEQLQSRDRVLQATATAADALLTTGNLEEAVNTALQIIGESLDTDRIAVLENEPYETVSDLSQVKWELLYEWHSSYIFSQLQSPEHKKGTFAGIETWPERLAQGESISYPLEALPEPFRSKMAEVGVQSIHEVPIFVEGQCWGALGIDDCRETKHRDSAELAVLKTAAACIGSAIERDRTQKAILQAEQDRAQELERFNAELQQALERLQASDRVLQATATAADALLTTGNLEEAVNTALQIIGESLDTDRIAVLENEPYETVSDLSQVKWELLYEWHSSYTFSQLGSSEHKKGTFAGIETWPERLVQGESISYPLEALPEPFRSKMAEVGVQSIHEVPIFVEGQCWGALGIDDCRETKHRDPAELAVLKTAAACIGSAIERERLRLAELRTQQALLKAQQDRVAELVKTNQALKNSLDRLAAAPDLEAFLGYVLTEISQQFDGKTASLNLFNPDNQTLHLHQWVAQGRVYSKQEFHQFGPLAEPIVVTGSTAWAFLQQHKFPLVINRDNAHQYLFPGTKDWQLDWAEREELQSGINILLSSGETPLGMLCMFSASRSTFTSEELEIAQALSHQASLAIQLTQLAAEAQQSAVLGERNRLARDIHDTLAQSLGGIVLHLQAADSIYTTELQDKQTHVTQARQLAKQALSEARRSVQALRPQLLEQTTLDQAINSLLQQLTSHSPLQITYQLHGSPYGLPPEVEAHLLRISRETITNSLRHAQATELVVDFTYEPRQVQLRIQDNGQGFDTTLPTFGYGLITMQERAQQISARLHLSSQRGQGTIVQVTLPIATAVTGAFYD